MILRTLVTREILSSLANFWINGHFSVQNIPISEIFKAVPFLVVLHECSLALNFWI